MTLSSSVLRPLEACLGSLLALLLLLGPPAAGAAQPEAPIGEEAAASIEGGAPDGADDGEADDATDAEAEETAAAQQDAAAATSEAGVEPEETFTLDTVVVTASRTERDPVTAPATISVITSEDLIKAPVGDLTDAIRHVPGVTLNAGTQGRRGINIRGMDSAYTLILIDGKRVNSSEAVFRHNDFDIGMIPVESIERIEVARGAMSSLYGSEALGGVVNIITKPISNVWTGGIDVKGQTPTSGVSGEELRTSAYVSGPLLEDRLAIRLTGTFDNRGIWHGSTTPGATVLNAAGDPVARPDGTLVRQGDIATLEGRSDRSGSARLVWSPVSNQSIAAEYGLGYQTREGEYFIGNNYGVANSVINRSDTTLSHEGRWGWGKSQVRGYWEVVETSPDDLRQDNYVAEANASLPIGMHDLAVGAETRFTNLDAPQTFESGSASVGQQAVYAQAEVQLLDELALLIGGRLDHHTNFGFHGTPRGYLVYRPIHELTLKGGVGTGFRSPTLRQLSDESIVTSCRGACVIVGNPDLRPEKSTSYELSASYDTRRWGLGLGVFQNDVSNLIDTPRGAGVDPVGTDPASGLPIFVPRNVNQARLRGVEANARATIQRVVDLGVNYTLLDAWDLEQDVELPNRPKHSINGQVDWRFFPGFAAFGRAQYLGEQTSGDSTIPGYALFDAGLSYSPVERLGFVGGVLNIADTRTQTDEGYVYQERGRTIYLGMNARY